MAKQFYEVCMDCGKSLRVNMLVCESIYDGDGYIDTSPQINKCISCGSEDLITTESRENIHG